MKITLTINNDNAAFESDNKRREVKRILRELAGDFDAFWMGNRSKLMDVNGNSVGTIEIKEG